MNFKNHKSGPSGYRKKSSDWRYPQIEHGNSQRGRHSTALRAASANATDYDGPSDYDPSDTSQFIPKARPKPRLNREQRAVKRAVIKARDLEWREWFSWHMTFRSHSVENKLKEEPLDLGKQPELIQPRRKRR